MRSGLLPAFHACYAWLMKVSNTVIGMLIGLSAAVGITLSQAETMVVDGQSQSVVALVNRGRVYETPIVNRCLRVGIPAGLVGAGIAYQLARGANLGGVFIGALILGGMASGWREDWPEKFGRAGANAKGIETLLHGMVGGLLGAAASVHMRKHHNSFPGRLQPPESDDAT